jgi:hypothetical protein
VRTLCVVILNYGTPDLAIACAKSALADLGGIDGEVIVVDNASPDDSVARLEAWRAVLPEDDPVRILRAPRNGGYASGNNLGVAAAEAEFYALLNSDTLVRPGAFAALIRTMRADAKIGIAGPQLIGPQGARIISRFRVPTPMTEFVDATGTDVFYRLFRRHVVPISDDESDAPHWIGFPCILLRRAMLDEVGRLDEGYFMYFEDIDFCRRAAAKGWRVAHERSAVVDHFCGRSSRVEDKLAGRARLPAYYYASRRRYYTTWFGGAGYVAANLLWYAGRAASYLRILALRRPAPVCKGRATDMWGGAKAGQGAGSSA